MVKYIGGVLYEIRNRTYNLGRCEGIHPACAKKAEGDVRLSGKDEHGSAWELSAKSALCVFLLGGHIQHILHADQNIDWNTIVCECDAKVYPLIKKFVKD